MGKLDDLERLQKLKESGTLTQEEFELEKNKILANYNEVADNNNQIKEAVTNNNETAMNQVQDIINNKSCNKCGNELLEEDKYCGKCGYKVNEIIKIKFNHLIIGIVAAVIIIVLVVIAVNFQEKEAKQTNTNNAINNVESSTNSNQILNVIDPKTKELKIDIKTLADTIIQVNDEIEEQNREIIKTPLAYSTEKQINPDTGEEIISYTLSYKGYESFGRPPFIIMANATTNNVFKIAVLHPYLNDYGTQFDNATSEKYYTILFKALNILNNTELADTISELESYAVENDSVSSDFNIKGVYIGATPGNINKYGNPTGLYLIYGTK